MSLILNSSQAQAVYDAMACINNVCCWWSGSLDLDHIQITWGFSCIQIKDGKFVENYFSQRDFSEVYGIE